MNPADSAQPSATAAALLQAAQAGQQQGDQDTQQEGNGFPQHELQVQHGQSGVEAETDQPLSQVNTGLSIGNEIKRLQQLHQLQAPPPSNALLGNTGQSHDQTQTFLQSMLDVQQKVLGSNSTTTPRFAEPLMSGATHPTTNANTNNLLPLQLPNLFGLMAQNQLQQQALQFQQQRLVAASTNTSLPLPSPHAFFNRDGTRRMRGGVIEPFPEKLHRLLTEVETAGRSDVISFVADGRAFVIHKPEEFCKDIVPLYFRQTRLSSFKRQLNLYGFELINTGVARGGYYHQDFVKGKPELCRRMRRISISKVDDAKGGKKKKKTEEDESEEKTEAATTAATAKGGDDNVEHHDKTTTDQGGLQGSEII